MTRTNCPGKNLGPNPFQPLDESLPGPKWAKLTPRQVNEMRRFRYDECLTLRQISERFNINTTSCQKICNPRSGTWKSTK